MSVNQIGLDPLFVNETRRITKLTKQFKALPEEIKAKVEEDPFYFVMEGGSDGTLGHVVFLETFGEYAKAASKYGAQLCKERNIEW